MERGYLVKEGGIGNWEEGVGSGEWENVKVIVRVNVAYRNVNLSVNGVKGIEWC